MLHGLEEEVGVRQRIRRLSIFSGFRHKGYPLLFSSTIALSLGNHMMLVAMGWLVLEVTDSAFSLGQVWAARSLPNMILGLVAGALSDKIERRMLLFAGLFALSAIALFTGVLAASKAIGMWHLLFIAFGMGVVMAFDIPSRQALAVDIVGRADAMNAISMNWGAIRVTGIFGGALAGVVIKMWGLPWCFFGMAASYGLGAAMIFFLRGIQKGDPLMAGARRSVWNDLWEGLRLLGRSRVILILAGMAVAGEVFGFSYLVVLPVFARDILQVGAIGLGTFSSAQSMGGLISALALASLGDYPRKGRLLLGIFLLFGVSLALFSQSPWYLASVGLILLIGAMMTGFDTMEQTLFLLNVPAGQRGRAMGIWQLSIGFMPVGSLAIGSLSEALGAQTAVLINGCAIISIFALVLATSTRMRTL